MLAVLAGTRSNLRRWRDGFAIGITAIGLLALVSRLFPNLVDERDLFQFLPGGENRLSYPLDYWNGLGIFTGLAFPLLLGAAVGARSAITRGLAIAPLPALVATIYLTSSRGGAATAAVGTALFLALTSRRALALAVTLAAGVGSIAVIGTLLGRDGLVDGPLQSATATDQGHGAAILIAIACIGAGSLVALVTRFGPRPRVRVGRRVVTALAVAALAATVVAVVAVDPVDRIRSFQKSPNEFQQSETDFTRSHLLSESGSGRWQFWSAAADEFESRPLIGRGAGSYEAWWAQHGSLYRFIRDAHSLYLETLAELGIVGFSLLVLMLGAGLVAVVVRLRAIRGEDRVTIASLAALLGAYCVAAGIDWMWELTVVSVVAIATLGLITGPASAAATRAHRPAPAENADAPSWRSGRTHGRRYLLALSGIVALALFVIATEAVPLFAQTRIRDSQAAVDRGDAAAAVDKARDASDLQPWAASPHLQLALVEEQTGDLRAARGAILQAIDNDPSDWRLWLVRARLETKSGAVAAAGRSLREAKRLNPRSPLFASG
jgi:tetratricopeptide (TPR) repeat protein